MVCSNMNTKLRLIAAILIALLYAIFFLLLDTYQTIFYSGNLEMLIASEMSLVILPAVVILSGAGYSRFLFPLSIIFILIASILLLGTVAFIPFVAINLFYISAYLKIFQRSGWVLPVVSSGIFLFMIIVSSLLRMDYGIPGRLLFFSIYDDVLPGGVPALFYHGVVIQSPYFVFTYSIITMIIYPLISVILAANYLLIYRTYRNSSTKFSSIFSGAATILGCQCEGVTGLIPSIVALTISILVIPLMIESVLLVSLTLASLWYLGKGEIMSILSLPARIKGKVIPLVAGSIALLAIPVAFSIGVSYGYFRNESFFFGMNFLIFLEGFMMIILVYSFHNIRFSGNPLFIAIISFLLLLIWLFPYVVSLAESSAFYYILMNSSALLSGFLAAFSFIAFRQERKTVFLEFESMMFSMIGIILLYASAFGITIWPAFSLGQQFIFSMVLVIISLPIMWYITNKSLVENAFRKIQPLSVSPY